MTLVDPSGEIFQLTGSKSDNEKVYKELQDMLGEKGAKNLTYSVNSDGTWKLNYKGAGGLAIGGEVGVALEQIIDSDKTVNLKISYSDITDNGFGRNINLRLSGGAKTTASDASDNYKTIEIRIHSNVAGIANNAFQQDKFLDSNGNVLTTTFSLAVIHEIGHAWGLIADKTSEKYDQLSWYQSGSSLSEENDRRAVRLENVERRRLGMGERTRHNP